MLSGMLAIRPSSQEETKQGSKCAVVHTTGLASCKLEQHDGPLTSVENLYILLLEVRRLQDISFTLF